jgi:hypothetical protein
MFKKFDSDLPKIKVSDDHVGVRIGTKECSTKLVEVSSSIQTNLTHFIGTLTEKFCNL